MNRRRLNNIAISLFALLLTLVAAGGAWAGEPVGTVTHLSGPLFAQKSDGTMKTLAKDSGVEVGDLLVTKQRTFARIKFTDGSEVTLRPETEFKIEALAFDQAKPEGDSAVLDLVKGGMRAITGQIGKRGNAEAYKTKTPAATIGIRGTIYEVRVCFNDCGELANGVYFFVVQGSIEVTNGAGSVLVGAGQYAYSPNLATPPMILPQAPPLEFNLPKGIDGLDCEVR